MNIQTGFTCTVPVTSSIQALDWIGGVGLIFSVRFRVLQPLCLGGLVSYFAPGQTHISKSEAYWYAGGIVFSSAVSVITFHPFILFIFEMGAKIRLGCSGLVYRKV